MQTSRYLLGLIGAVLLGGARGMAADADGRGATDMGAMDMGTMDTAAMVGHHHHAEHALMVGTRASYVALDLPAVQLVRAADGKPVSLAGEIDDGRPVVLSFMYATCTTVCPLTSQTLAQFQELLGSERAATHLVSITIDPEQDTPARLRDYASRFHAGAGWQHYTGTLAASVTAQRAFGVYRGDKMNHAPVTFLRAAPGKPWRRIDGFITPAQLLEEYHELLAGS
jgi:protein SCO1/2